MTPDIQQGLVPVPGRHGLFWLAPNVTLVIVVALAFGLWLNLGAPSQTLSSLTPLQPSWRVDMTTLVARQRSQRC